MRRLVCSVSVSVAVLLSMTVACAPSSEEAEGPAPLALDGVFTADEADAPGLDEIELRGDRYRALADGCTGEDCEGRGSFELDLDARVLRLVDDRTSDTATIPIEVDEADADEAEELAPPEGDIRPQQLLKKPQKLLVKRRVRLLRRAKLNQKKYTKQSGTCSAGDIARAQGLCRTKDCPDIGGTSRGINFCSKSGSQLSYSCACTGGGGGGGGACGTCGARFRKCMSDASVNGCQAAADCRGDFKNCADDLPGCARPVIRGGCGGYGVIKQ